MTLFNRSIILISIFFSYSYLVAEEISAESTQTNSTERTQVVNAREYLELSEVDPFPRGVIQWSKDAGEKLYLTDEKKPHLFFTGKLKDGYQFSFDGKPIRTNYDGSFKFKFYLPLQSKLINVDINSSKGTTLTYRILVDWKKQPDLFAFKVRENKQVIRKALGFSGEFERSVFVQLYSDGTPVDSIDLDSLRHAKLTFRVEHSLDETYDGWALTIRDQNNRIVTELRRVGSLPEYIDWRELEQEILVKGEFTYWINLYSNNQVFRGPKSKFNTIEGISLLFHRYHPSFTLEPQAEIGHFNYSDFRNREYSGIYLGIDLSIVLWNLFFIRGYTANSIHSLDENSVLTFIRVGGGIRLFGNGDNDIFGHPNMYQLNIMFGLSGFTISPDGQELKRGSPGLLLEAPLVLWAHHQITPAIEYGTTSFMDIQRISLSLKYYFLIRPWYMKVGLGFGYDTFLKYKSRDDNRFSVFRSAVSFYFFI